MRVYAQFPQHAQVIATDLINQRLPESPREIVVEVYRSAGGEPKPASGREPARPEARVVWKRPSSISAAPAASPADTSGAADHVGTGSAVIEH
jgi:hypothetical protein